MRRSATIAFLVLLLFGLQAAPIHARTSAASITVVDDHHTTLTLAAPPRRIIALAPNVTEILFALGLGSRVVGVSSYSNYPAAATRLPVVMSYTGPSLEKIIALRPDLLISAAIVPQSVVVKLRALHLKVLETDPHTIGEILGDIRLVGTATGIASKAMSVVASMTRRIGAVQGTIHRVTTHPRVYYELDKTLYTVGAGSFMDALITMAGGVNIAGKIANPYPQLSAEKVLSADPQYIILGDAAFGASPTQVAARPGWSTLSAVKLHHIYPFNDDLSSRPGPRIVEGLEKLARLLHPEAFR